MKRRTATRSDWRAWEREMWADAAEALEHAQARAHAGWRRRHPWLVLLAWVALFATVYGLLSVALWTWLR